MIDRELALRRIGQIEQRILAKHPKAARDGELASLLSSLRDVLTVAEDYELTEADEDLIIALGYGGVL